MLGSLKTEHNRTIFASNITISCKKIKIDGNIYTYFKKVENSIVLLLHSTTYSQL